MVCAWQLSVDSSGGSDKYLFPSLGVDPNIVTVYCGPVAGWCWIEVDSMHGPRQSGQPAMAISSPRNLSDSLLEITKT